MHVHLYAARPDAGGAPDAPVTTEPDA
jgi:hypothetical protein